jgi:hypothetical protein
MKKALPALVAFFFFCAPVAAQNLVLQGRIWCLNHQNANSTTGAENIVVIPGFLPQKSTLTGSNPRGYYEINTGIDLKKLEGKTIRLYAISKCNECGKMNNAVFVSADQANKKGNPPGHLPVDAWKLKGVCQSVELDAVKADGTLQTLLKQPAENLEQLTAASALVAPTSLLSLIAKLVTAGPVVNFGNFTAQQFVDSGKIQFGTFLFSSALYHTSNQGFNFSPWRNLSEAVFYNPSALVNSPVPGNISAFTNLRSIGKLSGYFALNDKLTLAAGGIYTQQDEFRDVNFGNGGGPLTVDSFLLKQKEYAAFLSPVYKINEKFSVAATAKFIGQEFNAPDSLVIDQPAGGGATNTFFDQSVTRSGFDADVSFTYKVHPSFQIGLNAMNIIGTQLYSRAFVAGEQNKTYINQRALGAGFCFKNKRLNVGADLLFTEDEFFDAAIGINYIPLNNVLLSGGVAVKQGSYSLGVRLKHFRIGYINDNNWLIHENRPGGSLFTKGRIYSGFAINF